MRQSAKPVPPRSQPRRSQSRRSHASKRLARTLLPAKELPRRLSPSNAFFSSRHERTPASAEPLRSSGHQSAQSTPTSSQSSKSHARRKLFWARGSAMALLERASPKRAPVRDAAHKLAAQKALVRHDLPHELDALKAPLAHDLFPHATPGCQIPANAGNYSPCPRRAPRVGPHHAKARAHTVESHRRERPQSGFWPTLVL